MVLEVALGGAATGRRRSRAAPGRRRAGPGGLPPRARHGPALAARPRWAPRPVLLYPDPILKQVAAPVESSDVERVAQLLIDTAATYGRCVGIAAPQIGELVRVAIVDVSEHPKAETSNGLIVLANPHVTASEGSEVAREGCLSLPDVTANVRRATRSRSSIWAGASSARDSKHERSSMRSTTWTASCSSTGSRAWSTTCSAERATRAGRSPPPRLRARAPAGPAAQPSHRCAGPARARTLRRGTDRVVLVLGPGHARKPVACGQHEVEHGSSHADQRLEALAHADLLGAGRGHEANVAPPSGYVPDDERDVGDARLRRDGSRSTARPATPAGWLPPSSLAAGAEFVLAGRSRDKLDALAARRGRRLPTSRPIALDDATALRDLLEPCEAVIACAGPFAVHGEPVVRAAAETGTHYLDTTGEQGFMKRVFDEFGSDRGARPAPRS